MYFLPPNLTKLFEMKANTIEVAQCIYVFFTANLTKLFEMKANTIEVAQCIYVFFTANLTKVVWDESKYYWSSPVHICIFYSQPHKVSLRWKQLLLK